MKIIVTFLCAISVCAAGVTDDVNPTAGYREGDRFFYFPDSEGTLYLVDSLEPVDEDFIRSYSNSDNTYLLYTRSNPHSPQFLVWEDSNSVLNNSFFDPAKETVFFVHGWNGNGFSSVCQMITEAFLENKDVNVIQLDWSRMASRNYVTAMRGVPRVGRELGEFITWLTSLGLSYDNIHLVGFSLGGHLVGNAGRATQGKIRRITCENYIIFKKDGTALDPAGPLWRYNSNRIVQTDGQYVEVIHTNSGFLGYLGDCGDADFYPNGGSTMPGCFCDSCSHGRAVEYLASTVKYNQLMANECNSIWQMIFNSCGGSIYPMGNSDLSKSRSGIFRVNTRQNYPF